MNLLEGAPQDWNEERKCFTVAETENYFIDIVPMIYNHRVVMTPKNDTSSYDWGWCYPHMIGALAAVLMWEPAQDAEPYGYIKAIDYNGKRTVRDL